MNEKWDKRFLELAALTSSWSKDPSTQVGAVVADLNKVVGLGYNGFPPGIEDNERLNDRDIKLKIIRHAEDNALEYSSYTTDCTIYTWPFPPCARCASLMISKGIKRVVSIDNIPERWRVDCGLARELFKEVGIQYKLYDKCEK